MNMRPILIFTGGAILGLSIITISASAHPGAEKLADKIATKFSLDKGKVEEVLKEHREDRRAEMEERYTKRLEQAVKDGKITAEQKDKLVAKHQELIKRMKARGEELRAMSEDERIEARESMRNQMQQLRDEIKAWEKENNIPAGYLGLHRPGRPMHGLGR